MNQKKEEQRQLWIARLCDLEESGMTQEEWCKRHNILYSTLRAAHAEGIMTIRRFPTKTAIYLSCSHIDMRKSFNGLAAVVQGSFALDPFQGALFVFCNKDKNKIKVLHWDKDGFALYYKRRERGRFCWRHFRSRAAR